MDPGGSWVVAGMLLWFVVAAVVCVRVDADRGQARGPRASVALACLIAAPAWCVAFWLRPPVDPALLAGCLHAMWLAGAWAGAVACSWAVVFLLWAGEWLVHLWTLVCQLGPFGRVGVSWGLYAMGCWCAFRYPTSAAIGAIWFWARVFEGCRAAAWQLLRGMGRALGLVLIYSWRIAMFWWTAYTQSSQLWWFPESPECDVCVQQLFPRALVALADRCRVVVCSWSRDLLTPLALVGIGALRYPFQRHPLKLLLCSLVCLLGWPLRGSLPSLHMLMLSAGCVAQLAAFATYTLCPKRMPWRLYCMYVVVRLYLSWGYLSEGWARVTSAQRHLPALPAAAAVHHPVHLPDAYQFPHAHSLSISNPIPEPPIRPPSPMPTIPSPLQYPIVSRRRFCVPNPSDLTSQAPAPTPTAWGAPAVCLILVLILHLIPLLSSWFHRVCRVLLCPTERGRWLECKRLYYTVQYIRCGLLFRQTVFWAVAPYMPVYLRETRSEVCRRFRGWGVHLKSSTKKHAVFPAKWATKPSRRKSPIPASVWHKRLVLLAALLLASCVTVAAGGVAGLSGVAAAVCTIAAAPAASLNLVYLAVVDPGMVVGRSWRASRDKAQQDDLVARLAQVRALASVADLRPDGALAPDPNPTAALYTKDPEHEWTYGNHPGFSSAQREQIKQLLLDHKDCFAYSLKDLTGYLGPEFVIQLTHTNAIRQKPRNHAPLERAIMDEKCSELEKAGIIVPAPRDCQYASNCTMPAKKDADGNWTDFRFCIDFRDVNAATVADLYGLHLSEHLFEAAGGSAYFSKIDMRAAFHQFKMEEASQPASAFYWKNQLWMFTRTAFGLRTAATFVQAQVDRVIGVHDLRGCCVSHIDDLLVHSKTASEHIEHLRRVFVMLRSCGLKAHPAKTLVGAQSLEFLGFDIGPNGVTPHAAKIAAVKALPVPRNTSELKSVLGFLSYYRVFVVGFSALAAPLNALLTKDVPWVWGPEQQDAYHEIKEQMCREGAAVKPLDPDRPIWVYSDWSQQGVGGVIAQRDDAGNEYMIACVSRSLNKHERLYSSYEGEALASVWAIKTFRNYLFGRRFTLVSDHQPLKWLMQAQNLTGKHARWALSLQDYDFSFAHRPGTQHQNVDVPSRFPMPQSYDATGACLDPDFSRLSVDDQPAGAQPAALASVWVQPAEVRPVSCPGGCTFTSVLTAAHSPVAWQHALGCVQEAAALAEGSSFLDVFPASPSTMLHGSTGALGDVLDTAPVVGCEVAGSEACKLRSAAADLCAVASQQLRYSPREQPQLLQAGGKPDQWGVRTAVTKLCTQRVGAALLQAAMGEGVVLYEPCGGVAAGLEGALANGFRVKRYLYSDIDEAACKVAQSRLLDLHYKYPRQLPLSAFHQAFDSLPADVRQVGTEALVAAGAKGGDQWLVVAGWSCEDLSAAGKGAGLKGTRSGNFFDILRIVGVLQQLQQQRPPAYILENTHMQSPNNHWHVRHVSFPAICDAIGQPVELDAARCGSYAHRLRNFWSNLACPKAVQVVCNCIEREQGRHVQSVMDPGRTVPVAMHSHNPPWYSCNRVRGEPLEALPTLVAVRHSRAYSVINGARGRGMVYQEAGVSGGVLRAGGWTEPNPDERERIMGYSTGCTAVPAVSEKQRHELMGRAMDRHAVVQLFAVYGALSRMSAEFEGVASLAYARPAAVPHRCLPPLSREQLRNMCPWALPRFEAMGWAVGQPAGAPRQEGLLWPLDHEGLPQGAGLGYTSKGAKGPAHACVSVTASGGLAVIPEGEEAADQFVWAPSYAKAYGGAAQQVRPGRLYLGQPLGDLSPAPLGAGAGRGRAAGVTVGAAAGQLPGAQGQLGEGGCVTEHERLVYHTVLAAEAEVVENLGGQVVDILEDSNVLLYMRANGLLPGELGDAERRRVKRRARQYELNGDVVVRMMADGTRRIVPPVNKRVDLINQTHAKTGHWGVRRTKGLLLSSYWWQGLEKDVARVLANCEVCGQVKATFNVADPQLHPLPISGMHYRWGCDMAGPFSPSARGNTYVMVCIEHFTKHVELIAVPDKTAETTAYAFLSHVLGRFGSCAEVVTDRGSEFLGAFHQLLEESMIDHRMTSASHPQADGLAERCVQSVKMALAKCVLDEGTVLHWDEQLQWIALGYRSSKQSASGFSPYSLMYGCEPCVPPAVKDRYRPGLALSFDTPEHQQQAAAYILMRAELLQRNCTVAMHNLQSAQHRDTLRYRQVRSGLYRPSLFKFNVGDYVYVRRQNASNTLMSEARPGIFRCLEVRDSGVLVLQGRCGSTMEVNQQNCAPCMLMNIDGRFDHSLRVPGADEHCVVCESADDEAIMLMCDGCGQGYHTYCLMPPLSHVPDVEVWVCPQCEGKGVLVQQILDQQEAAGLVPRRPNQGLMFPNAAQRVADAKALQLDGQTVWFRQGGEWVQGTLRFVHRQARPDAFARRPIRVQGMRGSGQWQTEAGARKLLAASAARPGPVAAATVVLPVDGTTVWVAAMAAESGGAGPVAAAQLPASFDLGTVGGCLAAGALLFQGDMSEGEAAELHHRMANVRQQEVHGLFGQGLLEWGTALLLRAVNLSSCVRLCTPCCHYGDMAVVQEGLQDRYRRDLLSPDVGPAAPCLPSFYKGHNRQSPLEWAFLFVPAGMEEVALAVAADGVSVGVAMLCHRSFMTTGPSYRQRLLQSYMDAGRLVVVSQRGQEYGWVCVFATGGDLSSMCSMPRVGALCELVV